ncbi:MAG: CHAT domain-containing protein [Candidatus Electrothrix sp. AX5]|nr:CHAT domain-containing protein [Candidatus Electrothrix sp. AX5]
MEQTTILLLTANPDDTAYLRIDREIEAIDKGLRLAGQVDRFSFKASHAVKVPDLRRSMQRYRPKIVHFSGHGSGEQGLCFESDQGRTQFVQAEALSDFFHLFSSQVRCVVLNACYSEVQAEAIARHIDYVVGMSESITDQAAIAFSVAFYESLGNGESIESSYKFSCAEIALLNLKEEHIPKLIRREQAPILTAAKYEQFSNRTVFLAECSDDLCAEREQLKICLQQQNVQVLPEKLYFFPDAQALQEAIRTDLARSELYIQLLSNVQPQRPPGMSTPLVQHQLVAETTLPTLQWRHTDTKFDDKLNEQFGTEQISCGLEEFKQHVVKHLYKIGHQKEKRVPDNEDDNHGFIFIDAAPEDMHLTEQLIQYLQEYDFCDVAVPLQDDAQDTLSAMRDLEENFKEANMVLLLYHAASQAWIRKHLRQCRKAQRGRKNTLIAVCQDLPEDEKKTGMVLPNLKIFNCAEFTSESCLPALIDQLKGRA